MPILLRDFHYTLRQLRKVPGFTLTAILILAFGIGAATAIFSVVEGVLLRPLPFPQPGRLISLDDILDGTGSTVRGVTAAGMLAYMRDSQDFSALGGYQQTAYELTGAGAPTRIQAARLTASIFPVLRVSPILGRPFTPAEDRAAQPVALLSYGLWHSRFHDAPNILGQKLLLDRKPYTILGVMPRSFEFPLVPGQLSRSQLWVPVSLTRGEIVQGAGDWNFHMIGRLQPSTSLAAAQASVARVTQEVMRGFPAAMASLRMHAVVEPLDQATVAQARPLVRTLFLAVSVVLLIAWRLILISGARLALLGCGVGALAAFFATRLLRFLLFQVDPLDPAVIASAAAAILLLALAAFALPAYRASAIEPIAALRAE